MKLLLAGGIAVAAAITFTPSAHADPDCTGIGIGDIGGVEQPLPITPGDDIGPGGALPLGFLLPAGPINEIGPAGTSSLEDAPGTC